MYLKLNIVKRKLSVIYADSFFYFILSDIKSELIFVNVMFSFVFSELNLVILLKYVGSYLCFFSLMCRLLYVAQKLKITNSNNVRPATNGRERYGERRVSIPSNF